MNEWAGPVANFGIAGLILFFCYRLVDKWAGPLVEAHGKLAGAMTMLAATVERSASDSREILLAVRVQSAMIGDLKALIEEKFKQ